MSNIVRRKEVYMKKFDWKRLALEIIRVVVAVLAGAGGSEIL